MHEYRDPEFYRKHADVGGVVRADLALADIEALQAHVAELEARDKRWEAAAKALASKVNTERIGQPDNSAEHIAALLKAVGAPAPLTETDTPKEGTDEHTDDGSREGVAGSV